MHQDHNINLGYLTISGKFWGSEAGEPTIALHGYLDNANSFDFLAPLLKGLRVYAMDFAGHGQSDYRREGELYTGLNDIRDVLAVADALGWQTFNIIGHSMGAEVGSQLAGLVPDRVNTLVCIDGFCGTDDSINTLSNLTSTLTSSFKQASKLKTFPSLDAMTQRLCEATGQNAVSARCLIERGHRQLPGGYTWKTDPRIKGSGPLELTRDQLDALIDNIAAEVLFIAADRTNNWLARSIEVLEARTDTNIRIHDLPGHHHLHMQDQVSDVAALINDFYAERIRQSA